MMPWGKVDKGTATVAAADVGITGCGGRQGSDLWQ